MRLMTPEQHAKQENVLKLLEFRLGPQHHDGLPMIRDQLISRVTEAIATLQALPELEVVGYVYGVMTDSCTRRSMANIKADIELKSGAPLYATKEPS